MVAIAKSDGVSTGRLFAWVTLLALGQLSDLVTTQAAMARGGMEGNQVAAALLAVGGLALLWAVKMFLVVAMGVAVWLVSAYWTRSGDRRWALAGSLVWRGLQLCVLVLALTAIHNLTVIGQLSS